jgi:spermidine synthase
MTTVAPELLVMEPPHQKGRVTVRLLEPPDSCLETLWQRLFNGSYDKPFIIDRGVRRCLHFDLLAVQSAMNLQHPDRLSLAYTRKMMAFLLFNHSPARVLLLGLGGGSLAKFCYRVLPETAITAVEVSQHVIALRHAFHIPADDRRFQVICAEASSYMAERARSKDVIVADACDREGVAPECGTSEFYQRAYECLSPGGVFVANLCVDPYRNTTDIQRIRAVFGAECVTLRVGQDGNVIVFAFKDPRPSIEWTHLETEAVGLKRRFGLDFPRYVRRAQNQAWGQIDPKMLFKAASAIPEIAQPTS